MKAATLVVLCLSLSHSVNAQEGDGVLMRCGESNGHGYFFYDELTNPNGPNWEVDGIRGGRIILVRLGDEWDIQFHDIIGASGYRQDGALVVPLLEKPGMLTVGTFGANYADIYTFDFIGRKVAWSSNKIGPIVAKVSVYTADCE